MKPFSIHEASDMIIIELKHKLNYLCNYLSKLIYNFATWFVFALFYFITIGLILIQSKDNLVKWNPFWNSDAASLSNLKARFFLVILWCRRAVSLPIRGKFEFLHEKIVIDIVIGFGCIFLNYCMLLVWEFVS